MAPMRKRLNLRAGAWGEEKSLWVMFSGWAQGRLYSSHTSPLHWPQTFSTETLLKAHGDVYLETGMGENPRNLDDSNDLLRVDLYELLSTVDHNSRYKPLNRDSWLGGMGDFDLERCTDNNRDSSAFITSEDCPEMQNSSLKMHTSSFEKR
ncbi:hypothetical protein AXG93_4875s1060 [Marchantia polymorpha subsp. ruderalis]|uniref:Uncharacterized protein n=1 Tax=Marchantia polymorpha subsp. ruderalis TaxID=1480154 RepID=A0A176WML9_MARPO|nr:hypothetical protein AXG93_4875s1060 [Marchantia polymorpha subsp. ruderalis]